MPRKPEAAPASACTQGEDGKQAGEPLAQRGESILRADGGGGAGALLGAAGPWRPLAEAFRRASLTPFRVIWLVSATMPATANMFRK